MLDIYFYLVFCSNTKPADEKDLSTVQKLDSYLEPPKCSKCDKTFSWPELRNTKQDLLFPGPTDNRYAYAL